MRKPGTDPNHVQMSDVLCDFCHREWTEDVAMIEGHHGSCVCGTCLTDAYTAVVLDEGDSQREAYECRMCLEGPDDRATLDRGDEPGWRSSRGDHAAICRRCVELAARALDRDPDHDWTAPKR